MKVRRWIIKGKFEGAPKLTDFELLEENISDTLQDGEILCKSEWLSVDPFVRAGGVEGKLSSDSVDSDEIPGSQIARVVKSRHESFPVDSVVYGFFGWREWTVYSPGDKLGWTTIFKLPYDQLMGLPESYCLGALGMPGLTAYMGVDKILEIKDGGTLVVSTAAGAVGNMVLQIGKLKGCKCLVFTGSEEKVIWLKKLGAGYIFNYKKVDLERTFKEFAPEGIDFYFDNVGGEFTYHVMKNMKDHGRIAVCGATSYYNEDKDKKQMVPFDYLSVINKKIRLQGFSVYDFESEWTEALGTIRDWILNGKIVVEESITEGFENMPQAFIDLLEGKNIGKQVVKA